MTLGMSESMRLTALSGIGVKGPACFLLETAAGRLLLDLGKGPDGEALPDVTGVGRVDAVIFSHGHVDHTGGVGLLPHLGVPSLHTTAPTRALARDRAVAGAEDIPARIAGLGVETGPSGHAPGAVWQRFGGRSGLVYTGDMSEESPLFAFTLPPPAEVLLFDASYGAADEPLVDQRSDLLAMAEAGPLLLPAPAGGRGLEMAVAFLESDLPVAICAAHREVGERLLGQSAGWLTPGGQARIGRLLREAAVLSPDSPARGVMIGAGPNAERGVTEQLAPRFAAENTARVIYTGHVAEGTPAAQQVAEGRAQFRRWNVHPTLTGLRALLEAVRPRIAIPAFCSSDRAQVLAAAIGRPMFTGRQMEWMGAEVGA
ncbi:MBL fold metallo-hydrolase [Haematobacter missouriensis]|uniref:MBL fold metallo-hydrolase n=1 Tax=Haematobacter missouriensis TaxID=366616 RepID=A0A225CX22_9RHOB|nr:MBL fold metallo-hydrolase [Haematobacter missouriensis]OWJ77835.1 MBL fold metallo-hydrolase [Haematobacter missouriensis]OWJ81172.1 MBL fold metallo-hydrolase [Haematobacter missouriensis]